MLFGILENNRFSYGLKGQSRKQLKAIYGSLEAIKKAIRENKPVFIVEGRKRHYYAPKTKAIRLLLMAE